MSLLFLLYGAVNQKILLFGGFCCLKVLELWRSECLCLVVHGYQNLMSLHLFSTFHNLSHSPCPSSTRLSSPESLLCPASMELNPSKLFPSSLPCFNRSQPLKPLPSTLPVSMGLSLPNSFHGPCPSSAGLRFLKPLLCSLSCFVGTIGHILGPC